MSGHPCDSCSKVCLRLFINCPIWQDWAREQNRISDEQENNDDRETVGDTEDSDDCVNI